MHRYFILADVCTIIKAINMNAAIALFQINHPKIKIQACFQMGVKN